MFEQKYIGVLHPEVQLRYLDFLFYDSFQLMEDKVPTNADSELLFSSGILKPLNNQINIRSSTLKNLCPNIILELDSLEQLYQATDEQLYRATERIALDQYSGKVDYFESEGAKKNKVFLSHRMLIPKTQACAVFLSQDPEQKAIPILPEDTHYYSKFVSGYAIKFIDIGIPMMPIRDLIKFKYDNQDKLRRLRLAIKKFHDSHDDFASMLEEIALALDDYKKSLSLINKKYEISNMELKFSFIDDLLKFITTFNISVFSKSLQVEKVNIQKQIDIEAAKGVEVSYIYEVGELAKQVSGRKNIIVI